jgi:hypothetical protein
MERRHFLKLAFGFAAGGVALAAGAQAAPLTPQPLAPDGQLPAHPDARPAVTTGDEVDRLKPEEVRWGRGRHRGWGRRHWGWGRRHWGWRRRHWGWRRRRWHRRRYWRRRYW